MYGVVLLGPRKVSAVQSLEVVASQRLPMYYQSMTAVTVCSKECVRLSECLLREVLLYKVQASICSRDFFGFSHCSLCCV